MRPPSLAHRPLPGRDIASIGRSVIERRRRFPTGTRQDVAAWGPRTRRADEGGHDHQADGAQGPVAMVLTRAPFAVSPVRTA